MRVRVRVRGRTIAGSRKMAGQVLVQGAGAVARGAGMLRGRCMWREGTSVSAPSAHACDIVPHGLPPELAMHAPRTQTRSAPVWGQHV